MANDVTFQREDFKHSLTDWVLVSDVCEGERAIKAEGKDYTPVLNAVDKSEKNKARNKAYKQRAVFYGATGRTLQGLIGTVFRKVPVFTKPALLDYMDKDVDGFGVSIFQQSQQTLSHVMKKGRHALYVDYPKTEKQTSKAEQKTGLVRATIISVDASNVINWRTEKQGGVHKLALVVIKETSTKVTEDGFGQEKESQYRVLRLIKNKYKVEVWREVTDGKVGSSWKIIEEKFPTDGKGKLWDIIPFTFAGAENNDTIIDKSPLLDLATLNIAHYRNSADYEDSAFFVGQAQPFMSGLDVEWRDKLIEEEIVVGSRVIIPLPVGGTFGYAQVNPNMLVKEAMDQKEKQMVALGARLVEKGQAIKTATEAQHNNEAEHSVLSLATSNVSEAYTLVLMWSARFMNADEDIEYKIHQEFGDKGIDAQMLTALIAAWQAGRLPSSDYWAQLRKHGLIDSEKTDDEIETEINNDPNGLDLDDDESVAA